MTRHERGHVLLTRVDERQTPEYRIRTLTTRETEVWKFLADGKPLQSIAVLLRIKNSTADSHKANLFRKLDVHTLKEATELFNKYWLN